MTIRPDATVVITTRNRKQDLRRALVSAFGQSCMPEVLVIDDGSDDGTSEMVRGEFPSTRLDRSDVPRGYIVQRNRGAIMARGRFVISIDDDAEFSSPETVARTLTEFDDPRIGAVAIPFVNVLQDDVVRQRGPDGRLGYAAATYIGTAHAVRRDLFLELGGYREQLFHQCEEGDFCLRMLEAGFVIRLGAADLIKHYESPRRDYRRMDLYGGRNRVLFVWHNAPARHVVPGMARTTVSRLRWGLRTRRMARMIHGLWLGFASIPGEWRERRPVRGETYRLFRELERRGAVPMVELCSRLPDGAGARSQHRAVTIDPAAMSKFRNTADPETTSSISTAA